MPTEIEAADIAKPADGTQEDKTEKLQKDLEHEPSPKKNDLETGESENLMEKKRDAEDAASKNKDRLQRFKALQARAKTAAKSNLKETAAEAHRLSVDPNALSSISRKHAFASHSLLKADIEAAGEDFERKRAWDWTAEESEKWDRRMDKKQKHRDNVAFQDYRQDAHKNYKRQLRRMQPDLDAYENEKAAAVQRAAANGGLELAEDENGDIVAIDKNGAFYSTADSTDFVENRPDRAAIDRLVADMQKAEETRLKKRRERGQGDDEADVTYINDKNKRFNQKLARFYNKYTAEIRDSFERGTMI
ncbi:pre-mRNA-splicing factor syf2 [Nannizzia gypsea CBS 118893]|uniref:Pre-mRNA-splicing factor SYF2 n=1 Tax=Arthroderma gypseum (strain ATCC MYA-4604 / CBS 118893) TaxID=535722 RepID=E4UYU4_ARTGP|nr:pre-mRNA-splicing factor syf2 [Nannizzia gypsea CBS 118893]EFR03274.1 pre-mRNA-splicing factor syf2 [Nannizzia gypsea CBS 118893]